MGPGIIIPLVIVAIVVPIAFTWAKKTFKDGGASDDSDPVAPGIRLTSNALRDLPTPEWRIVHEIAEDKLGGVEHVLIGPPGILAIQTSMDAVPAPPGDDTDVDAQAVAAIVRGDLDDALRRSAMASDRLVRVYWGAPVDGTPAAIEQFPGLTAVDGRRLAEWVETLPASLSPSQVDMAWQTVTTAIGRPDPLV
jgi:hypothetical protein